MGAPDSRPTKRMRLTEASAVSSEQLSEREEEQKALSRQIGMINKSGELGGNRISHSDVGEAWQSISFLKAMKILQDVVANKSVNAPTNYILTAVNNLVR